MLTQSKKRKRDLNEWMGNISVIGERFEDQNSQDLLLRRKMRFCNDSVAGVSVGRARTRPTHGSLAV